jgi:hypothetical protein
MIIFYVNSLYLERNNQQFLLTFIPTIPLIAINIGSTHNVYLFHRLAELLLLFYLGAIIAIEIVLLSYKYPSVLYIVV